MSVGLPGRIFEDMRREIVLGAFASGSRLPAERELSERYGASRFAVREAIAMLAQAGFVETQPQSGTYVRDFDREGSLETLVQVLRIRKTIDRPTLDSLLAFRFSTETTAAAEAAGRISARELELLAQALEAKRRSLGDAAALAERDYEFHLAVIRASGNVISRLAFQSFKPIYSLFTGFFYSIEGAAEASIRLNARLVRALRSGDAEASLKAMGAILRHGGRKVHEALAAGKKIVSP